MPIKRCFGYFFEKVSPPNGTEFADHENIAKLLKTSFFFTHPYSSWEKGSVENSNKLVRQYIPKKTNFDTINDIEIKQIQYKINNRPRKKLNFYSPKEIFFPKFAKHKSCIQMLNLPFEEDAYYAPEKAKQKDNKPNPRGFRSFKLFQ